MKLLKSITVAELREVLETEDDDAVVVVSADYGDHCHTEQALPLHGVTEERTVSETAYSQSGWKLNRDQGYERDDEDETPCQKVLVLR